MVVSFNYRVAAEGFLFIEGAPHNRGLLDQIAALRWIRANIAGFGGDPRNVTLFGESAGAGSIAVLMIAPAAAGLFRRGIAESMPAVMFGTDLAEDIAAVITGKAGSSSPQALADAIADTSIEEHQDRWGYPLVVRRAIFGPVIDGDVVPNTPWRAMAAGAGRDIDLIVGHNRDEYNFVVAEEGWPESLTEADAQRALQLLSPTPDGERDYRAAYPSADHHRLYELVCSDFVYRMPASTSRRRTMRVEAEPSCTNSVMTRRRSEQRTPPRFHWCSAPWTHRLAPRSSVVTGCGVRFARNEFRLARFRRRR